MKINGEAHYLWRAVDHEGEVLEVFATKRRDRRAVLKFLKRTNEALRPTAIDRDRPASVLRRRDESYGNCGAAGVRPLAQ